MHEHFALSLIDYGVVHISGLRSWSNEQGLENRKIFFNTIVQRRQLWCNLFDPFLTKSQWCCDIALSNV